METAIFLPVGVGLIPGVENRPVVHRIDTQLSFHEIAPLRELIGPRNETGFLRFDANLSCSGNHLPAGEKRHETAHESSKRDGARHEIIIVAPVAMTVKIGVVLVEMDDRAP